jgi:hypothetical protein
MTINVGVVGSRKFSNLQFVRDVVKAVGEVELVMIISGGAAGVDKTAVEAAQDNGYWWREYPVGPTASYGEFVYKAHERNTKIAKDSDVLIAFWDEKSTGTWDTIQKAMKEEECSVYVLTEAMKPKMTIRPHRHELVEEAIWRVMNE